MCFEGDNMVPPNGIIKSFKNFKNLPKGLIYCEVITVYNPMILFRAHYLIHFAGDNCVNIAQYLVCFEGDNRMWFSNSRIGPKVFYFSSEGNISLDFGVT